MYNYKTENVFSSFFFHPLSPFHIFWLQLECLINSGMRAHRAYRICLLWEQERVSTAEEYSKNFQRLINSPCCGIVRQICVNPPSPSLFEKNTTGIPFLLLVKIFV